MIAGIGYPRSGTMYTTKLLNSWGFNVRHEYLGDDGTVDWQLVSDKRPTEYGGNVQLFDDYEWSFVIHVIRHPLKTLFSVANTETFIKKSCRFRGVELGSFEDAVTSMLDWYELCKSKNPDFTFRVEDGQKDLFEALKKKYPHISRDNEFDNKALNHRSNGKISTSRYWSLIDGLDEDKKYALRKMCEDNGYEFEFNY